MPFKLHRILRIHKLRSCQQPAPPAAPPTKTIEELRSEARSALSVDDEKFNIVICGNAGVGKSSLINAMRGIKDSDGEAAPIGVVETTDAVKSYQHPTMPRLVLWDTPGAGTESNQADTYFTDKKLYAFDLMIIASGNRITETDLAIAKNAIEAKVPVAFVRSKSDVDLQNESESRDCDLSAEMKSEYQEKIKQYFRDALPEPFKDQPLFVVSAHAFKEGSKYEAYKLDEGSMLQWLETVSK